jgi:transcriptional regulator with XRE-family HTH domain
MDIADINQVGHRIRALRTRCGLSLRQLAAKAGVTAGMISFIERGKSSPSITLLEKILSAVDMDLASFFGSPAHHAKGPLFKRENMVQLKDNERSYTCLFPNEDNFETEMLEELIVPAVRKPAFVSLKHDIAGYVLSGMLTVEIKNQDKKNARTGDSFYIKAGTEHRGYASGSVPVRLITCRQNIFEAQKHVLDRTETIKAEETHETYN